MRSFGDVEVVMGRPVGTVDRLPVVTVGAVLATVARVVTVTVITVAVAVANILHFTIAIAETIRAAGEVTSVAAIAVIVTVAVATIILPRRVVAATRAGRPTTGRRAARATLPVGAVKAPRSRRGSTSPLDLQDVIATDSLVVHVMVRVIRIAAVLVLDESEQPAASGPGSRDITADQAAIALEFVREVARASAVAEAGHVKGSPVTRHDGDVGDGVVKGWLLSPGSFGKIFQASKMLLVCANSVVSKETRRGLQPSGTMIMLGRQRQPRRATTR
jgi:hypothetical protein